MSFLLRLGSAASLPLRARVSLRRMGGGGHVDKAQVVRTRVFEVMSRHPKINQMFALPAKVSPTAAWSSLGLDSLDSVELIMAFEEEFVIELPDEQAEKFENPAQVIEYFIAHPMTCVA